MYVGIIFLKSFELVWIDREVKAVKYVGFSRSGENIFDIFSFECYFRLIKLLIIISLSKNRKLLVLLVGYQTYNNE